MAKIYNDFQPANLMSFAKSFARLNGQPLDKSEIWYSVEEARAYAATPAAYVGQILAVIDVDHNKVNYYGIQDTVGNLIEIGAVNNSSEDIEEISNILNTLLEQIGNASSDNNEATGLFKEIEVLTEKVDNKANANDVYTKEDADKAIAKAVSEIDHLRRKVVDSVESINVLADDAHLYIYMVPTGLQLDDDKYDEYIVLDGAVEKVGAWENNLDNYATKDEVNKKVDKDDNARLITLNEVNKLNGIESGAQVNFINSVDAAIFTVDENKQLHLNDLSISKITDLETILNNKVTQVDGYTLLSPEDQRKLAQLTFDENNNLGISGTVNADNVQGLDEWLNKNAGKIRGLSENNLTDDLYNKITDILFISSINPDEFVVNNDQLNILAIDQTKITGLVDALNAKASTESVSSLNIIVSEVQQSLANYVLKETYDKDIQEIRDILTWKDI